MGGDEGEGEGEDEVERSALLSSESHALARTCRARTVTTTLGRRNYSCTHWISTAEDVL